MPVIALTTPLIVLTIDRKAPSKFASMMAATLMMIAMRLASAETNVALTTTEAMIAPTTAPPSTCARIFKYGTYGCSTTHNVENAAWRLPIAGCKLAMKMSAIA